MSTKKVISLGQCAADTWSIERLLTTHFDVDVVSLNTAREMLEYLKQSPADLVLVNRIFDRDGGSGLDFITRLKTDKELSRIPVMLVSNYEDAQHQAVTRGALPGFGKAALSHPETLQRLGSVLYEAPAPQP
jgi:CheY-like chemotaxis protein